MTRDQLLDELATGLSVDELLDEDRWASCIERGSAEFPELRSITRLEVVQRALAFLEREQERARRFLPPVELDELRRAKVRYGLDCREAVGTLGDVVHAYTAHVMTEPPGGHRADQHRRVLR